MQTKAARILYKISRCLLRRGSYYVDQYIDCTLLLQAMLLTERSEIAQTELVFLTAG
jgi:hypothetical protein